MRETQTTLQPEDATAVSEAVQHAVRDGLAITVVAGGHGPWSHQPHEGLRIELTSLDQVDVEGEIVHIGGGATWGSVAERLAPHGLAISSGDTSSVGVGGLTLGGGIGMMVRAWGLAIDQLVGAQVVTADGEIVETSAERHPELFWALRGGGGNFGIVTRFDFRAHELPGVAVAECTVVDGDATRLLRAMRDVMRDAPRELTVSYMDVPAMDPSAPAGARLSAVWVGTDAGALTNALGAVLDVPGVTVETSTSQYRDILAELPEHGGEGAASGPPAFLGGNGLHEELTDDLIDQLVSFRAAHPTSVVFLRSLGGAFGDPAQDETPFPARDAEWFIMAGAFDVPDALTPAQREQVLSEAARIQEERVAEYGNFVDRERADGAAGMHAPEALGRLREVKRQWDSGNVFHRNHNIR